MRTAPLWGLRLLTTYLHDGRASMLDAAILAHDGQGRWARERYRRLLREGKERLLAFLRTLWAVRLTGAAARRRSRPRP